jgi:hypothetical protein
MLTPVSLVFLTDSPLSERDPCQFIWAAKYMSYEVISGPADETCGQPGRYDPGGYRPKWPAHGWQGAPAMLSSRAISPSSGGCPETALPKFFSDIPPKPEQGRGDRLRSAKRRTAMDPGRDSHGYCRQRSQPQNQERSAHPAAPADPPSARFRQNRPRRPTNGLMSGNIRGCAATHS